VNELTELAIAKPQLPILDRREIVANIVYSHNHILMHCTGLLDRSRFLNTNGNWFFEKQQSWRHKAEQFLNQTRLQLGRNSDYSYI